MCGCEQGTCPGNCACGCRHTPPVKRVRPIRRAWLFARRFFGTFLPAKIISIQDECWCGTHHLGDYWHDPTHGRIDRDIQDKIRERYGDDITLAQREALESTTQRRRDQGLST